MKGRFRHRTWLRGHLPGEWARLAPKGNDCHRHEWYRQDAHTDACYHCLITRPHEALSVSGLGLAELERAAQAGSRAAIETIDRLISEGAVHLVPAEPLPR